MFHYDFRYVPSEEAVVGASAYPYSHEILVELTCRDPEEGLVVYSYAFEPGDDGTASAVQPVPERHCEAVEAALAEKEFEPETDLADAAG